MAGEFDPRKDSQPAKFKWRPQILVKLSFSELYDSKLSDLHPFDNMTITHWVKISQNSPCNNFSDPQWELICCNKWHPRTSEISTPVEIAVETHFHVRHGTIATLVFLPADEEASWLLLPSLVFLLSSGTIQPENTYSCILKVIVRSQKAKKG